MAQGGPYVERGKSWEDKGYKIVDCLYCVFPSCFLLAAIFYNFRQALFHACSIFLSMYYDLWHQKCRENCFMHKMCDSTCQRLCVALFAVNQFNNSTAVLKVSVLAFGRMAEELHGGRRRIINWHLTKPFQIFDRGWRQHGFQGESATPNHYNTEQHGWQPLMLYP